MMPSRFLNPLLMMTMVAAALSGGCNIASGVAYLTTPNPVVEAQYDLRDVPTVVFVDDRRNEVNPVRFRRVVAETASQDLLNRDLVGDVISPRDADLAARQLDRGSRPIGIDRVGEAVGADQVVYVEMLRFTLSRDGLTPEPYSACRIRVVDLEEGKRTFPASAEAERYESSISGTTSPGDAYLLEVTLPAEKSQGLTDSRILQSLNEQLAMETGRRISQLFYDHEVAAVGANLIYQQK